MRGEFTVLLHELSEALRDRANVVSLPAAPICSDAPGAASVVVTGMASAGKQRLVDALARSVASWPVSVRASASLPAGESFALHVHAESDVDGLVELPGTNLSAGADLVIPVDWESVDRSVHRISEALIARGLAPAAGA